MSNIFRFVRWLGFLFIVSCLSTTTNPLHAQWMQTNEPYGAQIRCFAVSGTNVFAGSDQGVFRSTDNGTNWTGANLNLSLGLVHALAVSPASGGSGNDLFAGTYYGVFRSTNNGTSWTYDSLAWVQAFAVSPNGTGGTNLFAGTNHDVWLSTDNGTRWTAVGLTNYSINVLAVSPASGGSGTNLFAGVGAGLKRSTNNGASWTAADTGLANPFVNALAVSPASGGASTNVFAGTSGGVFLSTNNGTNWTAVNMGLTNTVVYALAVSGTNLFAGTYGGVFLSTNNGTTWTEVDNGLTDTEVYALAICPNGKGGTDLFAGTYFGSVWRRPLSEMITSVERLSTEVPTHLSLEQNYPNPFNPSTMIQYDLVVPGHSTLVVYNMLGQIVSKLVDEQQNAGSYKVKWDGTGATSGIYFYRLQAGDYVETRKMILLQ